MNERPASSLPGIPAALVLIVIVLLTGAGVFSQMAHGGNPASAGAVVLIPVFAFLAKGFSRSSRTRAR